MKINVKDFTTDAISLEFIQKTSKPNPIKCLRYIKANSPGAAILIKTPVEPDV